MAEDRFSDSARSAAAPAYSLLEITPNDTEDLAHVTLALNVATMGKVRVTTAEGDVSDVTIAPGSAFPLRVSRVWQTGTTATGIRGLI